jgi:hypothetical protein
LGVQGVTTCSDCADPDRKVTRRGRCDRCYQRAKKAGDFVPRPYNRTGRSVMANGYVRVWKPGHPTAAKDGYAYEHRYVAWETFGPFDLDHEIHHRNHDRTDNRPENLVILAAEEHRLEHAHDEVVNQFGRWPVRPAVCGISGCTRPTSRLTWCTMHYTRWIRTGNPLGVRRVSSRIEAPYLLVA